MKKAVILLSILSVVSVTALIRDEWAIKHNKKLYEKAIQDVKDRHDLIATLADEESELAWGLLEGENKDRYLTKMRENRTFYKLIKHA